jgi:hypothetical protein
MQTNSLRTHTTNLTDDELLLLDVMFNVVVIPPMLRQCNFTPQFNLSSHSINDASLDLTLSRFSEDGIIQTLGDRFRGHQYISLTKLGGELWSSERCPVWEWYCSTRETGSIPDKSFISIMAVTSEIRDDFLRISFPDPIRVKRSEIRDSGLISWESFNRLHVGIACLHEPQEIPPEQIEQWHRSRHDHMIMVDEERTWWRTARELHKFTNRPGIAG